MKQPKKSVTEVVQKEMPEFAEEVASLSSEQLEHRLAQLAKDAEANQEAKEADEGLAEAREKASLMAAPYSDCKKAIRLKSRYLISLIKDKGGAA